MAENLLGYTQEINESIQELINDTGSPIQAFTQYVIDEISEKANIGEAEECYAVCRSSNGNVLGEINGYALSFNGETVSLFYTIYKAPVANQIEDVKAEEYRQAVTRLQGFYTHAEMGLHLSLEPSSRHFQICKYIYEHRDSICNVKLYVVSNGIISSSLREPKSRIKNKHADFPVWDVQKLYINSNSPSDHESIDIDLVNDEEFRFNLPSIQMDSSVDNYQCILVMVPGQFLYNLYENFNTNLLQNNVRFFLGFKGKKSINKEILQTLRSKPQRFLAYNNGITATAQEVQIDETTNNILSIQDLQILNGGQTTASIFYSKQLEKKNIPETFVDLSKVYVQMKLIILKENVREILSDITLYSNSQNKVKTADYSTNNAFNLKMQELSRSHYAPDIHDNGNLTQWYFMRVTGQYDADLRNCPNASARAYFTKLHPASQKFRKELLAKVWNAWNQYPYYVSLGDQGNYNRFIKQIEDDKFIPDEIYYEDTISLIILFNYMNKQSTVFKEFHQIKAQMIAYTFSVLNFITSSRISLYQVWKQQGLAEPLQIFIDSLAEELYQKMTMECPNNVTFRDFCKNPNTWEAVKRYSYSVNFRSIESCMKEIHEDEERAGNSATHVSMEDHHLIMSQGSRFWSGLSAYDNDLLSEYEKSLALEITSCLMNNRILTDKQVLKGKELLQKVEENGLDKEKIKEQSLIITDKKINNTLDIYNRISLLKAEDWDAIKIITPRVCSVKHAKAVSRLAILSDKKKAKPAELELVNEALDTINLKFNKKF